MAWTGIDYVWRFANGWQDAGASASWSPASGWSFGFDDYTTGSAQCGSDGDKCVIWPQATAIQGTVDQAAGTIRLTVPKSLLHPLAAADQDGSAFTFANTQPAPSPAMTWMEQLDNTPAFDFNLP